MVEMSHSQQVALAVIPKVAAGLSIVGSLFVMSDILSERFFRQRNNKKLSPYQRLLFGMSTFDLMMSTGLFVGTWAMPAEAPVYGSMGTIQTCEVEGFLGQAGVGQALYNATLSTYYVLTVRQGWKPDRIARRAEPILHGIPIGIALTTMIAAVPLDLYNFGLWDCWINAAPLNCTQSYLLEEGVESDCERGDNAYIYQWVFHLMWVMGSALVVTVNMFLVYRAVLKVEQATDKYMTPGQQKKRERSKAVAVQSYFYVAAMYISWGPVLVARFTQLIGLKATYGMFVSLAITIPMQGVWNAVAYLRPRYLLWRKNQRRIKREKLKLNNNTALTASSRSGPVSSDAMRDNTLKDQSSDDNNNNNLNTTSRSRHNRTNMVANSITKSTIRAVALGVIVDEEQQQQSPADEPPAAVKDKTSDDSDSGNYSDDEFFNQTHQSNLPALMGNSSHKSHSSNHSLQSLSRLSPRRSVTTNPAHRSMTRSTIRAIALGIICDPEDDNNNHSGDEFYDDQTNLVQEQHLIPPFGDMEEASGAHNHHCDDDDYNYSEGRPPIVDGENSSSSSNDSSQERFVDEHDNGGEETLVQTSGAHHQEQDPLYFL